MVPVFGSEWFMNIYRERKGTRRYWDANKNFKSNIKKSTLIKKRLCNIIQGWIQVLQKGYHFLPHSLQVRMVWFAGTEIRLGINYLYFSIHFIYIHTISNGHIYDLSKTHKETGHVLWLNSGKKQAFKRSLHAYKLKNWNCVYISSF